MVVVVVVVVVVVPPPEGALAVVVPPPEGALVVVVPPPEGALVVVPPLSKRKDRSVRCPRKHKRMTTRSVITNKKFTFVQHFIVLNKDFHLPSSVQ